MYDGIDMSKNYEALVLRIENVLPAWKKEAEACQKDLKDLHNWTAHLVQSRENSHWFDFLSPKFDPGIFFDPVDLPVISSGEVFSMDERSLHLEVLSKGHVAGLNPTPGDFQEMENQVLFPQGDWCWCKSAPSGDRKDRSPNRRYLAFSRIAKFHISASCGKCRCQTNRRACQRRHNHPTRSWQRRHNRPTRQSCQIWYNGQTKRRFQAKVLRLMVRLASDCHLACAGGCYCLCLSWASRLSSCAGPSDFQRFNWDAESLMEECPENDSLPTQQWHTMLTMKQRVEVRKIAFALLHVFFANRDVVVNSSVGLPVFNLDSMYIYIYIDSTLIHLIWVNFSALEKDSGLQRIAAASFFGFALT